MTKKNLLIIFTFIIALTIIVTLIIKYEQLNIAYKSVTTEAQVDAIVLDTNTIKPEQNTVFEQQEQNVVSEVADVVIEDQPKETETFEETQITETVDDQSEIIEEIEVETVYEAPKQQATTKITKEDTTPKTSTITTQKVESDFIGEYDIKNGGYAKYTDTVEAPKDWVEDWLSY